MSVSTLTLLTVEPSLGIRCPSPFCLQIEATLTLAGLPFTKEFTTPQQGPKGKLPVLRDGDQVIPDSHFIRIHLRDRYGVDLDAGLTDAQRAEAEAWRRMAHDHLYWAQVRTRWEDHPTVIRDAFFGAIPRPLRDLVFAMVARQVRSALHGQGLGRHARDELRVLVEQDLDALVTRLGDAAFLFGDHPTSVDLSVFPVLLNLLAPDVPTDLQRSVQARPSLVAYVARCEARLDDAALALAS